MESNGTIDIASILSYTLSRIFNGPLFLTMYLFICALIKAIINLWTKSILTPIINFNGVNYTMHCYFVTVLRFHNLKCSVYYCY